VLNAKLLSGEIELATIPTNTAATLYNKGVPYQLASMNTWA
jgi:NitT/TauT family transport system substrate-binding protein